MKPQFYLPILFICFLWSYQAKAQEGNQWFYSRNSLLDFNCSPATAVITFPATNDAANPCTSMADSNGNLLFYASRRTVYNKENKAMPHGQDSLQRTINVIIHQSVCAVPYPNNLEKYYIFFIDTIHTGKGAGNYVYDLNYAQVDMNQDNELGDVIAVKRNILGIHKELFSLTAARAKNKRDFWLVTYNYVIYSNSNSTSKFYDSLIILSITPSGVSYNEQPLYHSTKSLPTVLFSNDGKRIVVSDVSVSGSWITLYNFDKNTGNISHPIHFPPAPQNTYEQNVCFSPDNTKLYIYTPGGNYGILQQFDISLGNDSAAVAKSMVILQNKPQTLANEWSDMKVAPDGKIYACMEGEQYLKTIEKPNVSGIGCTINQHTINVAANTDNDSYLPNFVTRHQPFLPADISSDSACTLISFTPYHNLYSPYYKWDFGDPASGTEDTSSLRAPSHTYTVNGQYKARLMCYNYDSVPDTFTRFICIKNAPVPVLKDTALCNIYSVSLDAGNPGAHYLWNDNDSNEIKTVAPGTWDVKISVGSCSITDTAHVISLDTAHINLGNDTTVCNTDSITLNAGYAGAAWSTGQTGTHINIGKSGKYWAALKGTSCTVSDTIMVTFNKIVLGKDTAICQGDSLTLNAGIAGTVWSTGAKGAIIKVGKAGKYWASYKGKACTASDTIMVSVNALPVVSLGGNQNICDSSFTLSPGIDSGATYRWSTGDTTDSIKVSQSGTYWIRADKKGCTASDTSILTFDGFKGKNLMPRDTNLCRGTVLPIDLSSRDAMTVSWNDSIKGAKRTISRTGLYIANLTTKTCRETDSIQVNYNTDSFSLGGDTSICKTPYILRGPEWNGASYLWNTGSKDSILTVTNPGTYWLTVQFNKCPVSDTVIISVSNPLSLNLGNDQTVCETSVLLNAGQSVGETYLWSTGDTHASITVDSSGTYWVTATLSGCSASDTTHVTLLKPITFINDNLQNIVFCDLDSTLILDAGVAYKYLWSPGGDTTEKIGITASGAYTVTISGADGCTASKSAIVSDQCPCFLFTPNAFSPNRDLRNDVFLPISDCQPENYTLLIYNQWGERIFQSNDINTGWDGTYKNTSCPAGVYVYKILYKFPRYGERIKSGTVIVGR